MALQIAILHADETNQAYLREHVEDGGRLDCTLSFQEARHRPIRGSLAFIAEREHITYVAALRPGKLVDAIRRACDLTSLVPVPPMSIRRLEAQLLVSQRAPLLYPGGGLSEKASRVVLDWLRSNNLALSQLLDELLGTTDLGLPQQRVVQLAQERDAVATLLSIAGLEPDTLFEEHEKDLTSRSILLPTARASVPLEDPMVQHDTGTFMGWTPKDSDVLGEKIFTDGAGKTLHLLNVNRWRVETHLGPDLLYYHVQRGAFVLVQYKRMTQENTRWLYRPDDNLHEQLQAMATLDKACEKLGATEFRLLPTPSFVKICRLETLDIDSLSMVPGMYLARKQVEAHLGDADATGPRGGRHFSFDNTRDYLTNSMFTELVAHGFLGTSGASTELVQREIEASLLRGGGAVVGVVSDPRGQRPGWRKRATPVARGSQATGH